MNQISSNRSCGFGTSALLLDENDQ